MKLFKSLLVAPATLGLLAPFSANATEVNFNAISNYSDEEIEIDINSFKPKSNQNLLLSGGEGLVDSPSHDGGFSETTTASFSVDTVLGAIDGNNVGATGAESTSFDYQFNIGLSTTLGEGQLDIAIDSGRATASPIGAKMGFDTGTSLKVDGVTYSFPLGAVSYTHLTLPTKRIV